MGTAVYANLSPLKHGPDCHLQYLGGRLLCQHSAATAPSFAPTRFASSAQRQMPHEELDTIHSDAKTGGSNYFVG